MADYSSWKVPDLKAELKKRGIPQTGLRLKQQFIDKLVEEDAKTQPAETAAPEQAAEPEPSAQPEPAPQPTLPSQEPQPEPSQHVEPQQQEQPQPEPQVEPTPEKVQDGEVSTEEKAGEVSAEPRAGEQDGKPAEDVEMPQAEAAPAEEATQPIAQPAEATPEDIGEGVKAAEISRPQTSEANTELSTPLPVEEALEDKRKRKRRSQSPVPSAEAIANKKARAKEEGPQVTLKEDQEPVPQDDSVQERPVPGVSPEAPAKQDARFRDLFKPTEADAAPATQDAVMEDAPVEPALHAATASLYIDGLMRPLQPAALRNHLISLATAPDTPPNPEVIRDFYLDSIKTHCFVSFVDGAAASRVRSSLHGTVWPNERNRKTLRADFIPDEQIQDFIQTEEASRNLAGPPVRWEVRYDSTDEGIKAVLAESGSHSQAQSRPRESDFNRTPPSGPRGSVAQAERRPSNVPAGPSSQPGQGFKPLDELFESTTAKPKLYYLPVPRKIADKRLDQFDDLLKNGTFPRRGGDEMRRITFEDDDYFVDVGPEYGAQALQRRQGRGGRGGNPRRGR